MSTDQHRVSRSVVADAFSARYGTPPDFVARAPGRVNLIGEHTDYNDGFVLPMAIDRAAWLAFRPRADRRVVVDALDFNDTAEFDAGEVPQEPTGPHDEEGWIEYVRGVAWAFREAGHPVTRGFDGVLAGDVPIGAGLSSSAALELAAARAFATTSDIGWDATKMAQWSQRAENVWVGVNSGIMDQLIAAKGEAGHALLIDCRSLETRAVPIPDTVAIVVLDTGTRRGLVGSAYNERRQSCEQAAAYFGVRALRDVSIEEFAARAGGLDPITRKRAHHVVTEDARTLAAAAALERGDVVSLGALMDASHLSLRDDFEVSRPELDTIVRLARLHPACLGARMTGAGFGGCGVALVERAAADDFAATVAAAYEAEVKLHSAVYVCTASEGAALMPATPVPSHA
ncbi:MAG: galactokinase [Candidatus Eremiobacteraeota bacterium]|nr:galactokinase [Candidatus Eremiobacteraeota bacterium]